MQARLQARHGEQPDEAEWKRLVAIASLPQFLQTARKGPLRPWLLELRPDCGIHEMERVLRRHFRDHVLEVAGWMPAAWGPAVLWTGHLPDLPVLSHLIRGNPPPHWLGDDPELRTLAVASREERWRELGRSGPSALLEQAEDERPVALVEAWYRQWRRLWPETASSTADHLRKLAAVVARERLFLGSDKADRSSPALRALDDRLRLLFRRYAHEPAAAFAHLALTELLVERLRGALAVRIIFPPPPQEAA